MRARWPTVVVLGMFLVGCAGQRAEHDVPIPAGTRVVEAARAAVPPRLDGKLDDACWMAAPPATGFLQIDSDRPAEYQSSGYVCYDDTALYIAMKCLMPKGMKPRGKTRPHDGNVFRDEVVEIMIDPGFSRSEYYQLAVNAHGSKFDAARLYAGAVHDTSWNGDWIAATHQEDGFWSLEIAVPYYSLGITPKMPRTWGLNLCREAKTPAELSSIGDNGAFNHANRFAALTRLHADFSPYFFTIGPSVTVASMTPEGPKALFRMPVTNRTGRRKSIRIDCSASSEEGEETVASQVITLGPNETFVIPFEALGMEPLFKGRSDLYMVREKPKTGSIVVSEAATGVPRAFCSVKRPFLCEAMRIEVADPWRRDLSGDKTSAVRLKVRTNLPRADLATGELQVDLIARATGITAATRRYPAPARLVAVEFDTESLAWGAYTAHAVFKDATGRSVVSATGLATVLPGGKYRVRVLNNLVSELANAKQRDLLGEREIQFMNPRDGWCFFSLSGTAKVTLDSTTHSLIAAGTEKEPVEAMWRLAAGRHVLRVEGTPEQIIVRAVPELIFYAYPTTACVPSFGRYDWSFLHEQVLRNCNVIVSNRHYDELQQWVEQGRKWISNATVLGAHGYGGFASTDRIYKHWTKNPGFQLPHTSGVIADEFGSAPDDQWINWADALCRLATDPAYRGRTFYPWCTQIFGADAVRTLMRVAVESGWAYSYYHYPIEQPTEKDALSLINDTIVRSAKSCNQESFTSARDAVVTLGYMASPTCSESGDPNVNFKVLMEMEIGALANAPECFGTYGILWYSAHYSDEESVRWAGRLFRHYAVEGHTERLSKDPYRLTHLANGDFEQGLDGWAVSEAEPGGVGTGRLEEYGKLQGRYVTKRGDTFLLMKRSDKGPNTVSQVIKDLVPGRAYSVKMISADHGNITSAKSVEKKDAISLSLDNVEPIEGPRRNFQGVYQSHSGCKLLGFKGGTHRAYFNYHWYVFRAKGKTARLTISDRRAPAQPGGPAGGEVMMNFIEVQPYFE